MLRSAGWLLLALLPVSLLGQSPTLSSELQKYVRVQSPRVVLTHVRVIDGTGGPAVEDRNVVIEGGKISAIQAGADVTSTKETTVLDLRGSTVMPGIVGMHNHLFYIAAPNADAEWNSEDPLLVPQMTFSAPRLYLAAGVTTMRTTGSVGDLHRPQSQGPIDKGELIGPHIDVTGPTWKGANSFFIQMHHLSSPEEATQFVNYWADRGVTSFKAYMGYTARRTESCDRCGAQTRHQSYRAPVRGHL